MTAVATQTGAWLEAFTSRQPAESWVRELREAAFRRFAELGFPTTHDEEWRFTSVAPIARGEFQIRILALGQVLSGLPAKVQAGTLEDARAYLTGVQAFATNAFAALNTAFLENVTFIRVPRGAVIEQPIEIVYAAGEAAGQALSAYHPRTVTWGGGARMRTAPSSKSMPAPAPT